MRAWVVRRREAGELLPEPVRVGAAPAPFELLVVEVTDQGKRRPAKVARMFAPGMKTVVAELASVRLVWLAGTKFVLSGIEVVPGERKAVHAAQSWLCSLQRPENLVGYRMRPMYQDGVPLAHRQVMDQLASSSEGHLAVGGVMDDTLARHTMRAAFKNRFGARSELLDCELDWMGEERFQLSGLEQIAPTADRPARLLRQGWLIEFDIQTPEQQAYIRSLTAKPQR